MKYWHGVVIFAGMLALVTFFTEAESKCRYPCKSDITNKHRQRVGDLYRPAPGRRIQIRDTHRRIIGYIEADGSFTNKHRQKVLRIKP